MRRLLITLAAVSLSTACHRPAAEPPAPLARQAAEATATGARTDKAAPAKPAPTNDDLHAGDDALEPCPPGGGDELFRAMKHYDKQEWKDALACAAQAAAITPENPDAHSEKAAALVALGRYEEARLPFARALALNPDHPDALLNAADLYVSRLPSSRDNSELGLAYAARGHGVALKTKDKTLAGQFAVLEATALNNIGRGEDAIRRSDEAIAAGVDLEHARYEKATALYELCRFAEAKKEFTRILKDPEREAWAHNYLGLIAEREGDQKAAERELGKARTLDPEDFPADVPVTAAEFKKLVETTLASLPADMQKDVKSIPVTTQDLPDMDDLTANDPPLSPTILGLFRGPSLTELCPPEGTYPGPCRAIVLYRKNLARATRDRAELDRQVRITLIHEIGHLRGEDDTQLAARGLE